MARDRGPGLLHDHLYISRISPVYLPYISRISPLYLPISSLYLPKVFCTTTCFTPELRAALERGVARLHAGARLIVTTQPFESPRLTLLRREALPYAKGSLQFFAYEVGK